MPGAVFISSGAYPVSKEALVRTYAAETESTPVRVNLVNPGPTRTRMRAQLMPGEDPMTLPPPELVAEKIVALCLPGFTESGRLYDYPSDRLLSFRKPD
jgi:NAD(P)-dependent dehydrogenase (short-subunit alcohol dehydrogenase family)